MTVTPFERRRHEWREKAGPTWEDAREALRALLHGADTPRDGAAIGWIQYIGEGLSNVVFGATIQRATGREDVVVKLPVRDAVPDRDRHVRAEAALLRYLCGQALPFQVPRPLGEFETSAGLAAVQECIDGLVVNLRLPRQFGGSPLEYVAQVAAAVHSVDCAPVRQEIPAHATRRDHAAAFAAMLAQLDEPEARDTEAWVRQHLPPAVPASLLHGDLLGQNLRLAWDPERIAVIDWGEAQVGDPAYDLAIVTRGHRKPFGTSDGLRRFLDAYNRLAVAPLTLPEVRLHEVMLAAHLYRAATRDYGAGSSHAENERGVWRSVLARAIRSDAL